MPQILYNTAYIFSSRFNSTAGIIEENIYSGAADKTNIIVPTGKLVRYLKQDSIRKYWEHFRKPAPAFNYFTFKSFVLNLFRRLPLGKEYRIISDAYRLAVFEEAAEKADLKFFTQNKKKLSPIILKRLSDIVYGLKEDGISLESVQNDLLKAKDTKDFELDIPRYSDIAKLYEAYQKIMGEQFIDFPDVLRITGEFFKNEKNITTLNKFFPEDSLVLFDYFSEFKKPETDFINLFTKNAPPCALIVDYNSINGPLFGNLEDTIISLQMAGFKLENLNPNEKTPIEPEKLSNSEFLRRWLFSREKKVKRKELSDFCRIYSAQNREHEVKLISKLIRKLIIEDGIKPSEICICVQNPDAYSELFRENFLLSKIPANITERYNLSSSPIVTAIFGVLELVIRGFLKEDVSQILLSNYLSFVEKDKKGEIVWEAGRENLITLANKFRITGGNKRGGSKMWLDRFQKAIDYYTTWTAQDDEFSDEMEYDEFKRYLIASKKARIDFEKITSLINFKNKKYLPAEFSDIIKQEILSKFKIRDKIWELYSKIDELQQNDNDFEFIQLRERSEHDARSLSAFIKLLDEFVFILSDRFPKKKFQLDELTARLKTAVSEEKFQIHEKQNYGVTVTDIEQTRNIPYKIMILCGALDREFPRLYKPESFLGKELPDSELKHQRRERMLFYQFLTNSPEMLDKGEKQVHIFYPKTNGEEEGLRSPYIDALLKVSYLSEDKHFISFSKLKPNEEQLQVYFEDLKQINNVLNWVDSITGEDEKQDLAGNVADVSLTENERILVLIEQDNVIKQYYDFIRGRNKLRETQNAGTINFELLSDNGKLYFQELKKKAYSISELEKYAGCPFNFFINKILHIEEKRVEGLSLTPLEKGNILHKILYRFYTSLQQEIKSNNPLNNNHKTNFPDLIPIELKTDTEKFEEYKIKLESITKEEINKNFFVHPFFEVEKVNFLGDEILPGIIEKWLSAEIDKLSKGWEYIPALFELSFGMKSKSFQNSMKYLELEDGLKIRGKIDRIEFDFSAEQLRFLIADYKSSSAGLPNNTSIRKGISFQMPLYILAAEKLLDLYFSRNAEPDGGVYYRINPEYDIKNKSVAYNQFVLLNPDISEKIHFKNFKATGQVLKTNDELRDTLNSSVNMAKEIIQNIGSGDFSDDEGKPKGCKYCKFGAICRMK